MLLKLTKMKQLGMNILRNRLKTLKELTCFNFIISNKLNN